MAQEKTPWHQREITPLKPEIRLLAVYYLLFLSLLIGWNVGGTSQPVSTVELGNLAGYYREDEARYDLRELTQQTDQVIGKVLNEQGISIKDQIWRLREKAGTSAVVWTEAEVKAFVQPQQDIGIEQIKEALDHAFTPYGIVCRSTKGVRLGAELHYRLLYGMVIGGTEVVTYRITLLMADEKHKEEEPLNILPVPRGEQSKLPDKTRDKSTSQPILKPQLKPGTSEEPVQKPPHKIGQPPIAPLPGIGEIRPRKGKARVAIIIDDFGFVKEEAEAYFSIGKPLTIAVMPGGKYSREHAIRGAQVGFEVILHQPLEPLDQTIALGPGLVGSFQSDEEMRRQFESNLEDVPGAKGFNNHMGSKGTQDRRVMRLLLAEAKAKGIFFIDSRSIASTVGESMAQEMGVAHAGRDVFLDHYGLSRVKDQLDQLVKVALKKGEAIGIAHARPGVAEIIAAYIPTFEKAGIELVYASDLLRK